MYKPQASALSFIQMPPPRLNYPFMKLIRLIIKPYMRSLTFYDPEILFPERFVKAYKKCTDKKIRLILAFRHAYGDDPQLMAALMHYSLPRYAKKLRISLPKFTHAHFIYGAEVPMWSDAFVRWLLPQVGAIAVDHTRLKSDDMKRIRTVLSEGVFPLALAPEGNVTFASEKVASLETGTARFGFWCIEDLLKQNRDEEVWILPISSFYRYDKKAIKDVQAIISVIEKHCGMPKEAIVKKPSSKDFSDRVSLSGIARQLQACGRALLLAMAKFYHVDTNTVAKEHQDASVLTQEYTKLQSHILEKAFSTAERLFNLNQFDSETPLERMHKIRSRGWDSLFRRDLDALTDLEIELAKREAGEAWYGMRHMEIQELLIYVNFAVIDENEPLEVLVEIAQNYHDALERLKGGTLHNRPNTIMKHPVVVPGAGIKVNDYFESYQKNRKSAIIDLTEDLKKQFEESIVEYRSIYPKNPKKT